MSFETATASPTQPASGMFLFGMGVEPANLPYIFSMDKFMFLDSLGNVSVNFSSPSAAGSGHYLDLYNLEGTNGTSFVDLRLITRNVAGSGNALAEIYKRKNGQMTMSNSETDAAAYISFDIGGSQRAIITSAGNLGVGIAPGYKIHASGSVASGADASAGMFVGRYSSGVGGSLINTFGGSTFLEFQIENTAIFRMTSSSLRPTTDNNKSAGDASNRFSTIYAGTGTINTSDEREKAWIGGAPKALAIEQYLDAARKIEAELGHYQWLDQVETKGDEVARWHFGARAQRVIQVFMDCGLEEHQSLGIPTDAFIAETDRPSFRHAWLCFDTWEEEREPIMEMRPFRRQEIREVDEPSRVLDAGGAPAMRKRKRRVWIEGEEMTDTGQTRVVRAAGNRFGFRMDQMLAFLAWANGRRAAALEERLAAIEAHLAA